MTQESPPASHDSAAAPPKWRPIGRNARRVLGVLVEKAKTTPDAYPLTLNALTNGCNQKSNRDPLMNLEPHQVEETLEELRNLSAVIEVVGGGRVPKYRHLLYEWLGVDKVEAAIMTELLLRGAQTVGELRGRAARMEPIADVNTLRPLLESLQAKGLVIALSSPGRGQVVSHNLYLPEELEKLTRSLGSTPSTIETSPSAPTHAPSVAPTPRPSPPTASVSTDIQQELIRRIDELQSEVARIKDEIENIWSNLR